MLAAPRNHPFAAGRDPTIEDMDRQPFIMYSPTEGRYFYDLLSGVFKMAEIMPNYVQYISQTHTMLALVSAGIGIALVPESARSLHFDGIVLRPIRLNSKTVAELFLVWRRSNQNPALLIFRDLLLNKFLKNADPG